MMKTAHAFYGLALLLCLNSFAHCLAQARVADAPTPAKVRQRVNTIIRETLQRGEITTADGVKAMTRIPPSSEDVEEIKSYGDQAVLPLQEHFASGNGFEYEIAMRLMGELGGKRIIEPFQKVILYDQSARKREYALRWITQGPWDLASKVITHAAENDRDAAVRKVARELLTEHSQ